MSTNFLSLPSELRNKIYQQTVVSRVRLTPCARGRRYNLTPGLLRTNKMVHSEASSLLYARNRFEFTFCSCESVASFFEEIGCDNANYIRHVCLNYPKFSTWDRHNPTIESNDIRILTVIQSNCANLSTLTLLPFFSFFPPLGTLQLGMLRVRDRKAVSEAVAMLGACFRKIRSLQEVIVEVSRAGFNDHVRKEMERHGWIVRDVP